MHSQPPAALNNNPSPTCLWMFAITAAKSSKWWCSISSGMRVFPLMLLSFLFLREIPTPADHEKWSMGRTLVLPSALHKCHAPQNHALLTRLPT